MPLIQEGTCDGRDLVAVRLKRAAKSAEAVFGHVFLKHNKLVTHNLAEEAFTHDDDHDGEDASETESSPKSTAARG